jgi:hypothetical protein
MHHNVQVDPPACKPLTFQAANGVGGGPPILTMEKMGCLDGAAAGPPLGYCQSSQPEWSALRDPSFGHAIIEVMSDDELALSWYRNQVWGFRPIHGRLSCDLLMTLHPSFFPALLLYYLSLLLCPFSLLPTPRPDP